MAATIRNNLYPKYTSLLTSLKDDTGHVDEEGLAALKAQKEYHEQIEKAANKEIDDANREMYISKQEYYDEDRTRYARDMIPPINVGLKSDAHAYLPEHFPKRVILQRGQLFDYNNIVGGLAVSQRFKELIERVAPGVDNLYPVEIYNPDSSRYNGSFWYWNVTTVLDAVNHEWGGGIQSLSGPIDGTHMWSFTRGPRVRDRMAVHADQIKGLAGWFDLRKPASFFISDALLEGMRAEGMEGWDIESEWSEI